MVKFKLKKIGNPGLPLDGQNGQINNDQINKGKRTINISIVLSVGVILVLCIAIVKVFMSINFGAILRSAGSELRTDNDNYTNFLLIGTGDANHEGADLTDSLMVVSLNESNNTISMISIPRDLHVKDPKTNVVRINEIYATSKSIYGNENDAINHLEEVIGTLTGQSIQYFVKINFSGFQQIVDSLGGVDIDVKEAIYDPFYPKGETRLYEIFSMPKGVQHMKGETALKYARSRETSSDFSRSQRQQELLYAIKEKALKSDVLLSKSKLTELLGIVKTNLQTNLSVGEMLTLGAIAKDLNQDRILTKLLNDNPVACGGFLYPPPLTLFGGAFTLLPAAKDGSEIQKFVSLVKKYPEALKENQKIVVLNGTKEGGVAGETKQVLQRYCLDIDKFGNGRSKDIQQTTIFYSQIPLPKDSPEDETEYITPKTLSLLQALIPQAKTSDIIPQEFIDKGYTKSATIIIELGYDYINSDNYLKDSFLPLYKDIYAPPAAATTDAATSTATPNGTTPSAEGTTPPPAKP